MTEVTKGIVVSVAARKEGRKVLSFGVYAHDFEDKRYPDGVVIRSVLFRMGKPARVDGMEYATGNMVAGGKGGVKEARERAVAAAKAHVENLKKQGVNAEFDERIG